MRLRNPNFPYYFKAASLFIKVNVQLTCLKFCPSTTPTSTPYRKFHFYTLLNQGVTSVASLFRIFSLVERSCLLCHCCILIGYNSNLTIQSNLVCSGNLLGQLALDTKLYRMMLMCLGIFLDNSHCLTNDRGLRKCVLGILLPSAHCFIDHRGLRLCSLRESSWCPSIVLLTTGD